MAENKINDGVGKKIVDALKMQNEEFSELESQADDMQIDDDIETSYENQESDEGFQTQEVHEIPSDLQVKIQSQLQQQVPPQFKPSYVDTAFQQSIARNLGENIYPSVPDDFDYPANVAVLKQLIAKLPTGVSKQTGALIIKQTMEALGISMQSVMQEARQVQETLNNNSKECQADIVEYRKQIGILEAKSKQYQRQSAAMSDIINLFVQA